MEASIITLGILLALSWSDALTGWYGNFKRERRPDILYYLNWTFLVGGTGWLGWHFLR